MTSPAPGQPGATRRLVHAQVDFASGRVHRAEGMKAVLGFDPAAVPGLAPAFRRLLRRMDSADRHEGMRQLRTLLRGPVPNAQWDFRVAGDDGVLRSIETVWTVERDERGRPRRAVVSGVDITSQHRIEASLRESEARYRLALVAGRMGSWETDLVGGTRLWSEEGMALFGLRLPAGRGQVGGPDDEYVNAMHPEDRHLAPQFHRLAQTQDSFAAEYRIVRPDGATLWLSGRGLVVSRTPDGRARRLVSIMADVTERRLAEDQLRIERMRLAQALEVGQMGVFDYDVARDVLWWSPQMYALIGLDPAGFVPTADSAVQLVHPEDREHYMSRREQGMRDGRPTVHEFRVVKPAGPVIWIVIYRQVEYAADGRPARTYGVAMDITERKRAELALLDADRRKDDFIATLAHELRNPLAPIRNAVALVRRARRDTDAQLLWAGDVIERQIAQMARLLDDLLDVSRLTRDQLALRVEELPLSRIVEQAVEIARPAIDDGNHALALSLPSREAYVRGDLTRLAQVFSNLLINAAKYTPPGGSIRLDADALAAGEVRVAVSDDGIGIAPEQLPQLFRMFGRLDSPLKRRQDGLGIGLALARLLIEKHGGRIEAHSRGVGQGSTFVVHLPLAAQEPADDAPAAAADDPARPRARRVLVVDDVRDSADSLAMLIEAMGHRVDVAYDGLQAIELAQSFAPEIVLLDIGMPGLDGLATCRRLRQLPNGASMTLVAQTGWGQAQDRERSQQAGFDRHVVKPIDPALLDELLAEQRPSD